MRFPARLSHKLPLGVWVGAKIASPNVDAAKSVFSCAPATYIVTRGWGGVGWDVLTFVAHEHMFDATQQLGLGWGGVGWDVLTFVAHEHMFDATQQLGLGWGGVGWDVLTFVAHEHMFDATQQLGLGWGGMGCVNIRCT